MTDSNAELIDLLREVRRLLGMADNEFLWSPWRSAADATGEIDSLIQALGAGDPSAVERLEILFAPTGPLQEVSVSSGWDAEFLRLAERFDGLGPAAPPGTRAMPDREAELTRKLAETFHLGAGERQALPGGRVRGSCLVAAVGDCLAESGWYPRTWRPDQPYDGMIIEARPDGFRLHEKRESGMARYAGAPPRPAESLADAVRTLVTRMFGDAIDGIPIDWTA